MSRGVTSRGLRGKRELLGTRLGEINPFPRRSAIKLVYKARENGGISVLDGKGGIHQIFPTTTRTALDPGALRLSGVRKRIGSVLRLHLSCVLFGSILTRGQMDLFITGLFLL